MLPSSSRIIDKIHLFLALSRTPHGILDMATPAFAALLWLGGFPSFYVTFLGLMAIFSGYTAVYALNDVVGYKSDKEKLQSGALRVDGTGGGDLDAMMTRHPMAQGLLPYPEGVSWTVLWGSVALICAYLLNPVCLLIFLLGCLLEMVYCLLWRISPYRALVNGVVKTLGAMAAVFAVDPFPDPIFLLLLFLTLFSWEIGGQNIPNDWADMVEDRRFGARTIPVFWGTEIALGLIWVCLIFTAGLGTLLIGVSPLAGAWWVYPVFAAICTGLLLMPARELHVKPSSCTAMALFNRACYFPLCLLALVLVAVLLPK